LRSGFEPAVIAQVLRIFLLFVFALASAKTNNNEEEKERSAEG
jgi:hypothetical protein